MGQTLTIDESKIKKTLNTISTFYATLLLYIIFDFYKVQFLNIIQIPGNFPVTTNLNFIFYIYPFLGIFCTYRLKNMGKGFSISIDSYYYFIPILLIILTLFLTLVQHNWLIITLCFMSNLWFLILKFKWSFFQILMLGVFNFLIFYFIINGNIPIFNFHFNESKQLVKESLDKDNSYHKIDLSNRNFTKMTMIDCVVLDANMENTNFHGANFQDTTFGDGDSEMFTSFKNANLTNSNFKNTKLQFVDFRGSDLSNCNFEGADISQVNFKNTDLSKTNGIDLEMLHNTNVLINKDTKLPQTIYDNIIQNKEKYKLLFSQLQTK